MPGIFKSRVSSNRTCLDFSTKLHREFLQHGIVSSVTSVFISRRPWIRDLLERYVILYAESEYDLSFDMAEWSSIRVTPKFCTNSPRQRNFMIFSKRTYRAIWNTGSTESGTASVSWKKSILAFFEKLEYKWWIKSSFVVDAMMPLNVFLLIVPVIPRYSKWKIARDAFFSVQWNISLISGTRKLNIQIEQAFLVGYAIVRFRLRSLWTSMGVNLFYDTSQHH